MKRAARSISLPLLCALGACGLVDGLKGSAGEPETLSSFSWHGAVQIDRGLTPESDAPRVAFGQGTTWVAFQDYDADAGKGFIWVASRAAGGSYGAPAQVPPLDEIDGGALYPTIAIGAEGPPVLAFQGYRSTDGGPGVEYSIWGARLDDGGQVDASAMQRLDSPGSNTPQISQGQSLAVDAAGNALVAWSEGVGLAGIYATTAARGQAWSSPAQITTEQVGELGVAAGAAGNALIGWPDTQNKVAEALPIDISQGQLTLDFNFPLESGASSGWVWVAARGGKAIGVAVTSSGLATSLRSGGDWGPVLAIPDSRLAYYANPVVAVNSSGQAALVWRDRSGDSSDSYGGVLMGAFFDGASWTAPVQISAAIANSHAWWAALDINEAGEAVAAWADFDSTSTFTRIYAAVLDSKSAPGSWEPAVPIDVASPDAGLAGVPQNVRYCGVALDPAGASADVVWIQHEATTANFPRVWSNWLEAR